MSKGLSPTTVTEAALAIADDDGLDAVTMSAVARRLQVQVPTLYGHVGGLHALLSRMTLRALEEMADAVADAVAGRSGRDALRALADAYRSYAHARPGSYAAARLPLDHEAARESAGPRHVALTAAVLRGYALAEAEHTHAIRLLGSAIHGFVTSEASGAYSHSNPGADASWGRVVDALDAALRHWPGTSAEGQS